jgi:hypothetical protein
MGPLNQSEASIARGQGKRIHFLKGKETPCGLGPKRIRALQEEYVEEDWHITCSECKNLMHGHDRFCGWCRDWHDCSCKIQCVVMNFPIDLCWCIEDDKPGIIIEGADTYDSWEELKDHAEGNTVHFENCGHTNVVVRFKVGDQWLRY